MGCEFDDLLRAAWERVGPGILADEDELRARLARRRSKMFTDYVPRVLCAAVRASDSRIDPWDFVVEPEYAVRKGMESEHEVTITAERLRELCRPIEVVPGERARRVQAKLGLPYSTMIGAWRRGEMRVHHYRRLGGSPGKPVPVLFGNGLLDPGSSGGRTLDRLVEPYWKEVCVNIPDDLTQTLTRRPRWRRWRGVRMFWGWSWVCPGCQRAAATVYYPAGLADFALRHEIKLPAWAKEEVEQMPERPGCFACARCHGTRGISWATPHSTRVTWQYLVGYLSGCLLYGYEVRRPEWLGLRRERRRGVKSRT